VKHRRVNVLDGAISNLLSWHDLSGLARGLFGAGICGNVFAAKPSNARERRRGLQAIMHWRRQPGRMLGLTAALFSILLVQNASGFPFRSTSANLSARTLYHNLDSLVGVVLTGSRHMVKGLETLYQLRQLALGALPSDRSSVPVSLNSPPFSSAHEAVCSYRPTPRASGIEHRCILFRLDNTGFPSVPRC
jgi:hypothetical protein